MPLRKPNVQKQAPRYPSLKSETASVSTRSPPQSSKKKSDDAPSTHTTVKRVAIKKAKTKKQTGGGPKRALKFKNIEHSSLFHGLLPRTDAESLLTRDGDFLVRTTQLPDSGQKAMVISVMYKGENRHIIPKENKKGEVYLDTKLFDNISDMVKYHYNRTTPLMENPPILLLHPVTKPDWELKRNQVKLENKLGEGAFGEVYCGTLTPTDDSKPQLKVAVKLAKQGAMNKDQLKEFMAEARLMRTYNHPNIVLFLGVVVQSEPLMIVMELVPGGSLDSLIRKRGDALPVSDRLGYCHGAATGLEYLHSKSCMHRDVAARNCLIGFGVVKISDFGMCRQEESFYKMAKKGKVPIRWLSPETLTNGVFTFKSDVFSYGVLVWEIFSNCAEPYPGVSNSELPKNVRRGYRMSHPEMMPTSIRKLVDQCWLHNPTDRPDFTDIIHKIKKIIKANN